VTTTLPQIAAKYVQATNEHDAAAFLSCFRDDAVVNDAGREYRGLTAIADWSQREIMAPKVELEVLEVVERAGEIVVTTKVEGNFDRTGLPDPVVIDHHLVVESDRIARLTCRLAGS
jgi:hypothetical protein